MFDRFFPNYNGDGGDDHNDDNPFDHFARITQHHRFGMPFHTENTFEESYRCYSTLSQGNPRENVDYGGKIILPQSALVRLTNLNISYPMLFQLEHDSKITHCGVLEFTANEGHIYLPDWMMKTLNAQSGSFINVTNIHLPLGKYVKIQPQSPDFLDISDPKAVLENTLRHFSCLTEGDIITIHYNHKLYDILVVTTKPTGEGGICIVETDLEVDFDRPKGYVSPKFQPSTPNLPKLPTYEKLEALEEEGAKLEQLKFQAFSGSAQRLNSRPSSSMNTPGTSQQHAASTSISETPNSQSPAPLNLPWNRLFFGYRVVPVKVSNTDADTDIDNDPSNPNDADDKDAKRFGGAGKSLRSARSTPTQS